MAERLALPTSDLPEPKRRFIAQSLSCSPFHCLKMTEILLKGRKTLTHPSIFGPYDNPFKRITKSNTEIVFCVV